MRVNHPVTGLERMLQTDRSIVSKTDLQGNIIYCNPYFIEISGFAEHELIGAPQNIIRHPDMPAEAFRDLWATIKEGMPWTGLVKNRCKNGDHYWVKANVTPLTEHGRVTAYLSVRTKPERKEVEAAELLYASMRQQGASRLSLQHGKLQLHTPSARLRRRLKLSANARLTGGMSVTLAALLGFGALYIREAGISLANGTALFAAAGLLIYQWYVIQSKLLSPVKHALAIARTIASGDLTSTFTAAEDTEMGQLMQALQQMNANLLAIVGDVRSNILSIAHGTRDIASANGDLSQRTESQASSLQQTSANMDNFAIGVSQNTEHARQANQLADQAEQIASEGGQMVGQLGATMQAISQSAGKIENIISLIDGIAFQTNILALNAAVEAARAGEQGRGFAVVANEVRNLAQRSAAAAKEIKGLIDDSVASVETGNRMVSTASDIMHKLGQSVQNVNRVIHEISAASEQQNTGVHQVNQAIVAMDDMTQQNAAMVEQAAASASELALQAHQLEQAISIFTTDAKPAGRTVRQKTAPVGIRPASQLRG